MFKQKKLTSLLAILLIIACFSTTAYSDIRTMPLPNTLTLSFDDGPNPRDTPRILNILRHYQVHAIFFVTASLAKRYPNLVRRIVAEGHVVGDHTMTHPFLTHLSKKRLDYEIGASKNIITHILGYSPACLRPPFLATNKRVKQAINAYGMREIMGAGTEDYRRIGVKRLTKIALGAAHAGERLIFHDGPSRRAQTVAALPGIIEGIRAKGLGFSLICQR